jgi:predicted enzyme related to lactoylglutathione lyase
MAEDETVFPKTHSVDLYAGISVDDYEAAMAWYEKLFGCPPTFKASDDEAVWDLSEHRSVFILHKPEHAGHAIHSIFVNDLDALVKDISARGLEPVEREEYPNGARKAIYHDPEGNEVGFGDAPQL